jgi:hypothetical protein
MSAPDDGVAVLRQEETAIPSADTLDACGLSCGRLEPLIAKRLRALEPGRCWRSARTSPRRETASVRGCG